MQSCKIFFDRAGLTRRLGPRDLIRRLAVVTAGIRLHHTGIDGKALTLNQAGCHARGDDTFEDVAKEIALPEPMEPVLRESRVVGNRVIEIEPAKPPVCEMEPHLLA